MTKIKKTGATRLCAIDEIPLDGAKGYTLDIHGSQYHMFVIRKQNQIYAYQNRCPHLGTSLDWSPDQFLNTDNSLIQCSTHGAQFRIEDGLCIFGPCVNQSLTAITTEILNNDIIVYIPYTGSNRPTKLSPEK